MRADRLVALLLLMQARGRVTAAQVASELEVSVATARRDLAALSAAGVPVYSERGRSGGWCLLGGARTDLTGLTAPEMRALFLLLGPTVQHSPHAKGALRKLLRALPETFRAQAQAAAGAIHVDPARWGVDAEPEPVLRERLGVAVAEHRVVVIEYAAPTGHPGERTVRPWGLVDKAGIWYLLADTATGRRTFRLDRISAMRSTADIFEPPTDLDLAAVWQESARQVQVMRSGAVARVRAPERIVPALRSALGQHHVHRAGAVHGGVELEVSADSSAMLARQLAGWAPEVEVLGPREVRAELAQLGRALVEQYEAQHPAAP